MRAQKGFTLIELMITVVVVGILASIAYPSYQQWVLKARRAEARAAIMQALQQQERFFTATNGYAAYTSAAPAAGFKSRSGENNNGYWDMSANLCLAPNNDIARCIVVTATLRAGFTDTRCTSISASSDSVKTSSGTSANDTQCWQ